MREESCICSLLVALYVFEKLVAFWYPLLLQAEKDLSVWVWGTTMGDNSVCVRVARFG